MMLIRFTECVQRVETLMHKRGELESRVIA